MQNKSFTISGVTPITAPCPSSAFDLVSAATFNFQHADPNDGHAIGDAAPAVQIGTGSFRFQLVKPEGVFQTGQTLGYVTSGAGPVYAVPASR